MDLTEDRKKEILDSAAAFAKEYEFYPALRSDSMFQGENDNGKFTVKLAPEAPNGYIVEASSEKLMDAVKRWISGEDIEPEEKRAQEPISCAEIKLSLDTQKAEDKLDRVIDKQVAELTLEDIKEYICPNASNKEAYMFLKLCQARNLNPFIREAYLIKYDKEGTASIVVGKDAFTRRAEEHPQFDGFKAGILIKRNDEFDRREGSFLDEPDEILMGGWAEVYKKNCRIPFRVEVSMKEYNKKSKTNKPNSWDQIPCTMIRKVALVQALREAFPSELSGMYDQAEMGIDPENEISEAT